MEYIDLHVHTTASDGTFSPTEVVKLAEEKKLKAIAITDHDTVKGVREALLVESKVEVIPGIEISVDFPNGEMHMLGLHIDIENKALEKLNEKMKEFRARRNVKIVDRLNELGCEITIEEVEKIANGATIGKPHIAEALMRKGCVKTIKEAFKEYLGDGKKAHILREKISKKEAIQAIHEAGGCAVLAHPDSLNLSDGLLDGLLSELAGYGLDGIEAYYGEYDPGRQGSYAKLARKHNLIVTGGSDFHGKRTPDIDLGRGINHRDISADLLEGLAPWKKAYKI